MPRTTRDTPESGKTNRNEGAQHSRPRRSPWRDPNTIRGSVIVGVASGLILLAGSNASGHTHIEIDSCSATVTIYSATVTTTWRDDC